MDSSGIKVCRPGGTALTKEAAEYCGFGTGAKLLDIGCGYGAAVAFLLENGFDASGIDASSEVIGEALRENKELPIRLGEASRLEADDGSFNGVFMECVLSLLEDKEAAISEAKRVLKPGGWLVISDVYYRSGAELDEIPDMLVRLGFKIKLLQDRSDLIRQMVIESIMRYGSTDKLWEYLCPCGAGHFSDEDRERIKRLKPGYFLLIASECSI